MSESMLDEWQQQQQQTLAMVRLHLERLPQDRHQSLRAMLGDYLAFRAEVAAFQRQHVQALCLTRCYQSRRSACCKRDTILTFFAEVVINALLSTPAELDRLTALLAIPYTGTACLFLGEEGCRWRLKPLVCEMFLCDEALACIAAANASAPWQELREREKRFRWPDRPVLFDRFEAIFRQRGCRSALMYLHTSPGLLRVKKRSGQPLPPSP